VASIFILEAMASVSSVKRATKLGGNSNRDTESGYYNVRKERLRACSRKVNQIFKDIDVLHQHTGCIGGAFFMPETLNIRQHTTGNRDFDATYLAVANAVAFLRAFKKPTFDFDINAVVDAYNHDDGLLLMQTAASLFRDCGVGDETITALQEEAEYALVSKPAASFKAQLGVHLTAAAEAFTDELKQQREAAEANVAGGEEDEEQETVEEADSMDADESRGPAAAPSTIESRARAARNMFSDNAGPSPHSVSTAHMPAQSAQGSGKKSKKGKKRPAK
jgi:hypothetical protein